MQPIKYKKMQFVNKAIINYQVIKIMKTDNNLNKKNKNKNQKLERLER
jgi:hypothetical protein